VAIKIDFLSNTRDVTRGVEDLGEALDGVSGSLDGVARDAQRSGDKVADAYSDAAREGERSAERLEQSFKEASDATAQATKRGADDMARNTSEGTTRAKADLAELGNEAKQNAAETFSSFDGSAASFADGIQGTLGGVVSSLGPIGAAAGAAGALGIGLIMSSVDKTSERTQALKERTAELAQEYLETGEVGQASLEFVVDQLKEMATETDEAAVSLADLRDIADKSGNSYKDLAEAYAGSGENLDDLIRKTEEQKAALEESNKAEEVGLAYRDRVGGDDPRIDATQKYIEFLEEAKTAQEDAAESERLYAEANGPALEAKADLIRNVDEAYDDAAGGAEDFINEETGLFDVQGFIDAVAQRERSLRDYQETLATAALSPDARAFISSQGLESAATFMAGYKSATPAQQAELNRIWSEAGSTSSGSFSGSIQAGLDQAGYRGTVVLTPDMSAVERAINRVSNTAINIAVKATTPVNRVP
jgi:hypothetical protein